MKNEKVKLTPYQALFYYEWLQNPLRSDYNLVVDSTLTGDLCTNKLNDSILKMVNEHFVYAHNPVQEDDELYWKPRAPATSVLTYHADSLSESEMYAIVSKPFDLEKDLLFRMDIIKLGEQKYRMIMVVPHIAIDGLTTHILYEILSAGYNNSDYKTYPAEEQVKMHNDLNACFDKILSENKQKIHDFWTKHLDDLTGVDLTFLKSNVIKKKNAHRYVTEYIFTNEEEVASRVKNLKHDYRITPYIFGQLVLAVLLHRISGQKNIALTYPIAILEGSDYIYGAHVNSMIIDYRFNDDTTLNSLIDYTLKFFKELKISKAKYLPVQEITHYATNSSVLDVGFAQTFLRDHVIDLDGTKIEKINHEYQVDLVHKLLFEQEQHEGRINYRVKYDKDVLDEKLVGHFVTLYQKLYEEILDDLSTGNGDKKTKNYQLVDKVQYKKIVTDWNNNQAPFSSDKTTVQVFEEQVIKRPDNIALVYENTRLTYDEFNKRANRLAHYLIKTYNIKPGDLVGLCLDKSEHMLVAIMGVLKSGAAYVPMDPTMPDERIAYMMSDASAKVLLTSKEYKQRFKNLPLKLELVDDNAHLEKLLADYPIDNPVTTTRPDDLIYVMYTSGTTGRPKGVMVEHRNVNRLVINTNFVSINETDNVLSLSGYQFDGSTYDFFQPLLNGASLVLASKDVFLDLDKLNELIDKEKITNFYITTALFNSITDAKLPNLKNVKYIIFGGEEASIAHVRKFRENFKNVILVDGYGPTETTTFAVTYRVDSEATELVKNIPIGNPITNTTAYILDENMDILPIGSIGELYIGGAGVTRGYLNNPELTSEKFLKNPFQTDAEKAANYNGTIYKTGDLVRYLPDGKIDYIGRNDFQVKIRGFRIELGEIENTLLSYTDIKKAVVLAKDHTSGTKYLIGYYVSDEKIDETKLENYLSTSLPDFMIPSVFVHLNEFPLTNNGKVDKRALPEPVLTDTNNYVAAENDVERKLCDVYAELLGIEPTCISVVDDFYKLGGNSIQAIKLTGRLNKALDCKIQVSDIFHNRTIRSLANFINQDERDVVKIVKSNITKPEEQLLSFAQQRLWFIESYEGGSSAYNIPMIFEIKKVVDIECLKKAICTIVSRHEVLRSLIKINDDGVGYQSVIDIDKQPLEFEEEVFDTREELNASIRQSVNHIFDLGAEYPIYIKLYKLGEYTYMSIVIHHIAFDGWSTELFIKELLNYNTYYQLLKSGNSQQALQYEMPKVVIQYRDFALWQKDYLSGDVLDKQLSYWTKQLSGYETLNLATDKVRPSQIDYRGADIDFELDENISTQLKSVAKELNVSMYNLLLSGYYLLLSAFSNQEDIVVGSPIAGRNHPEIAETIGFFVNTLALRQTIDANQPLIELIKQVAKTSVDAQNNQDLPFEKLVEELHIDKDTSRHPIVQVMFGVQSFANEQIAQMDGLLELYKGDNTANFGVAKFDLTTMLDDSGKCITGTFNYATALFTKSTIESYIATYVEILKQFAELGAEININKKVKDIHLLDSKTYNTILEDWNQTQKPYSSEKTICQLIEEQVERVPDSIAIVYNDTRLTYRELNERANQLANYLISTYDIRPNDTVALCLNKSEHMLIAILGVLKSGAAYVPMEASIPAERIAFIARDARVKAMLTEQIYEYKIGGIFSDSSISMEVLDNNDFQEKLQSNHSIINPKTDTTPNSLAYIIYTSGTTGNPKGVMINHQCVNRLIINTNFVTLDETDNTLSLSSYQFDGSIYDFFAPLLSGASLVLTAKDVFLNMNEFNSLIEKYDITNFFITTALFNSIVDANLPNLKRLKYILFGGEQVSFRHVIKFRENFENVNLVHVYGPTETTVFATSYLTNKNINLSLSTIPIGYPIANTSAYVLDKNLRPLPVAAIGELYIGGAGVAQGYLNNAELTAQRFLNNPFQNQQDKSTGYNERIYKTGDLVRYLPDGSIEYVGRNDFQVKIRGFRIELGEIETTMASYPSINKAFVLAQSHASGIKYLVGYYVSDAKLSDTDIYDYMSKHLPDYMIPSILIHMSEFPLTVNGKVDQRALPKAEFIDTQAYIAPANETEEQLCQIYGSVLGIDASAISVENDFFKLGGDSISSIQLVNRIRQRLDVHLTVKDIFNNKTIRSLYTNIISCAESEVKQKQTEQGTLSGNLGLLPIQQWFFSNLNKGLLPEYNHFNQSFIIKTPILDKTVLKVALQKLIEQHDGFRLAFKKTPKNGEYQQYYQQSLSNFDLDCVNIKGLSSEKVEAMMTNWQSNFDIFGEHLFHVAYLEGYDDGSAAIHFALHHLIVDGVSWRLIKNDLETIYKYLIAKKEDVSVSTILGNKGSSYRQWVDAVSRYKDSDVASSEKEKEYWKSITAGISDSNKLLTSLQVEQLNQTNLIFDVTKTSLLLRQIHKVYNTQINDVLLTALSRALTKLTNKSCHHILLEGHGRENIATDININNTIGWFTSMYPVVIDSEGVKKETMLSVVKDMLRSIPNNGIGYGALIGYIDQELPRITFNYLGQFDAKDQANVNWSFSDANSGVSVSNQNKDHNILSINGGVIDGELRFSLTGYIDSVRLADFAENFKSELALLIDALSKEKRTYLTRSDIDYIISQSYLAEIQEKSEIEGVYLANSLQQGFIYHALNSDSEDDSYKIQLSWDYHNPLNTDLLKQAWILAQKKYPSLRLRFGWKEELIQIVDKEGSLNWIYKDISSMNIEKQDKFVENLISEDRALTYNLQEAQLFKVYLIKRNDARYTCLLSNHHAILDGWSLPVLINYTHKCYLSLKEGNSVKLEEDTVYPSAQRYLYNHKSDNIQFWNEYLPLLQSQEDLSSLLKPSQRHIQLSDYKQVLQPAEKLLYIKDDRYHKLKDLCVDNGFTFNALLQYCWHKQLNLYGHSDTTVVGMTVSGRNLPIEGIEDSVGLYINTLPIIMEHKDEKVVDAVISLQNHIGNINSHSDISLIQLQKNGVRLFNSLFVFENFPMTDTNEQELKMEIKYAKEKLDYPLGVSIFEQNQQISFKLLYAAELFDGEMIDQLLDGVSILLDQLIDNASAETKALHLLNENATQKIIYEWNNTQKDYPSDHTIIQLFEEQVQKTPENIAFVYRDIRLTYRKLNERANQLASYLIDRYNIRPDEMIALCLDRSEHMLIAMLGVMKSGAAYVPMDTGAPDDRIKYMVSDTSSKVVLTNKCHKQRLQDLLPSVSIENVDEDTFVEYLTSNYSKENPKTDLCANNLAYVIYTSGTTGNPKGVMLEHSGVVNLAITIGDEMGLTTSSNNKCLWYASYIFDAHVFELYKVITSGNCIYLIEEDKRRDIRLLGEYISQHGIEIATLPPVLLEKDYLLPLRILVVAGEVTNPEVMDVYKTNNVDVINAYGPTEDTVCSTLHHYQIGDSNTNIGRSIANSTAYVLDKNRQPVPINAVGELYVGGAGVARGYLNNLELSAKHFVSNPFQSADNIKTGYNGRIYKTGDLVRFDYNGDLEYIGRSDFQVKIRGFRIELGEIETRISNYPDVKKAVVLAKEHTSGTKYLVGYYTSDRELDNASIISYLEDHLPEYMVPSVLVHLHDFPMTVNGKLDRRALPDPDFTDMNAYVAPQNRMEEQLCEIFGKILDLKPETISVEDDFFRLGGNSILAIKLGGKINDELGLSMQMSAIFTHKTIRLLSEYLLSNESTQAKIEPIEISDPEEQLLSFAQERLWFIESYEGGSNAYNIPLIFEIKPNVNIDSLQKSIRTIVHRHEVLRSLIKMNNDGQGYQLVIDDEINPVKIEKQTVKSQEELDKAIAKEVERVFDLEFEYPIHLKMYQLDTSIYMSIVIHHIASDGWSTDLLIKELLNFYYYEEALRKGKIEDTLSYILPDNLIQYRDFALWQRKYLTGKKLEQQLTYWKSKLSGFETLNLPTDKARPLYIDYKGADIAFEIDEATSANLRAVAKDLNVSLYSLLLSGYYILLSAFSNQQDIVVGTPIAGRNYKEIEGLIGLFINTLVMRQQIDSTQQINDFVKQVGQAVNEAQMNQDLPFEKLVEELNVEKSQSRHPIFQVMFGLQSFGTEQREEIEELFRIYSDTAEIGYHVAKFDLTTMMDDSRANIVGTFNYATSLFESTSIEHYIVVYKEILRQLSSLDLSSTKVSTISYLPKATSEMIITEWNKTKKPYPSGKTINQLFEEQVEKTPDSIAVIYEDIHLTYTELNERANALASYLICTYDIQPDDLIALCMSRSELLLVTILGVLKAGGAYVPMDPNAPDDRITYMVSDTKAKVVLTDRKQEERLTQILKTPVDTIDEAFILKLKSHFSLENVESNSNSRNLAYVIYTSGTTGNPKGAMIEHESVANRIAWMNDEYPLKSSDKILQKTTYTFDVSVWELFWANWYGATVILADSEDYKDNIYLLNLIQKQKITILHFVPSMLAAFEDTLGNNEQLRSYTQSLRYLFCSGEALNLEEVQKYHRLVPNCEIHNLYGPTEATVDVLYYDCNNAHISEVLIGRPIANTTAYVLSKDLQPLPIGAIGELYIGGVNVGRGYLNNPQLSAERFLSNPFQSIEEKQSGYNGSMYKTGDLVKYKFDGNIEYIGRNDFQVKIRGFRIELGEIETRMLSFPGIKQAVVIAKDHVSGTKYMVGYYVSDKEQNSDSVRDFLQKDLPEYMVPSVFVHLTSFPLTSNGKLDRKALPEPKFTGKREFVAPENTIEEQLCQVFAEVLGLDSATISVEDNFIGLGGNSILAIKLVHRINKRLNSKIKLIDVLGSQSIRNLGLLSVGSTYQPIVELNKSYSNEVMIMIHPGMGGCDVYIPMAAKLASKYHCYGIDSYNLYHEKKKQNLSQLAEYYLNALDDKLDKPSSYRLLGWSLGGQIALEIASKLEQRGETDITVFLLDTWMADLAPNDETINAEIDRFMEKFDIPKKEKEYIKNTAEVDSKITKQPISNRLKYAKVLLLKAIVGVDSELGQRYPYNNVDESMDNTDLLKIVEINSDHYSLLDHGQEILDNIFKFLNK